MRPHKQVFVSTEYAKCQDKASLCLQTLKAFVKTNNKVVCLQLPEAVVKTKLRFACNSLRELSRQSFALLATLDCNKKRIEIK